MRLMEIWTRLEIRFWVFVITLMEDRRFVHYAPSIAVAVILVLITSLTTVAMYRWKANQTSDERVRAGISTAPLHVQSANDQYNALFILVDELGGSWRSRQPVLRGVWLIVYLPDTPYLTLLPIFPGDDSLAREFSLESNRMPAEFFLKALKARNISWDNYFVVDEDALLGLMELAGGVELEGELVLDASAVTRQTLSSEQPSGQARLAGALCRCSADLFAKADSSLLVERLSGHLYSDLDWPYLTVAWSQMRGRAAGFTCEFPTLVAKMSAPSFGQ